MTGARALLGGLVDYAGLFPPSALPMAQAVGNYARYLAGDDAWMLGRFVVPAARLIEFDREAARVMRATPGAPRWRVTVIAGSEVAADLAEVDAFQKAGECGDRVMVDTLECRAADADAVARLAALCPPSIRVAYEVNPDLERGVFLAALARVSDCGGLVKIRTGGLTAEAIPSSQAVASFIWTCACARVPFKATAGLHHPVRGTYPLTYEPGSPTAEMHGFMNVFVAGAVAWAMAGRQAATETPPSRIAAILDERDPAAFVLDDEGLRWRRERLTSSAVASMRAGFAVSFGSCSFDEPVTEARVHGWVPAR